MNPTTSTRTGRVYVVGQGPKLKLDLHTHCHEATFGRLSTAQAAEQIVAHVKARGLDGIAITDHLEKRWAYDVKRIIDEVYAGDALIIPGQEVSRHYQDVVELYLPNGRVFRFLAHPLPLRDWDKRLDGIHGVEIKNGHWKIEEDTIREVAEREGLLLLANSDAHALDEIGRHYNEIDLSELYHRAEAPA